MKQDVMTALREMRKATACIMLEMGKLLAAIGAAFAFAAVVISIGWLIASYTLYTMSVLLTVIVCGWFYIEYKTARDIRIWDEICKVNKGEAK